MKENIKEVLTANISIFKETYLKLRDPDKLGLDRSRRLIVFDILFSENDEIG